MGNIAKQSRFVQFAREYRERRAFRSALGRSRPLSKALSAIYEALELASQRRPTEAELANWAAIEARRQDLLSRSEPVEQLDFGAGSREALQSTEAQNAGVLRTRTVGDLAAASSDPAWCEFLYFITRRARPKVTIELGSCVGISAGYITAALEADGEGRLWTLEGSPEAARLSGETLDGLGRSQLGTVVVGRFDDTLEPCLEENGPIDLAYVDGHHDGPATIRYFEQMKEHLAPDAILIFDDIHFSSSMEQAWRTIVADADARGDIRIRSRGIVVM